MLKSPGSVLILLLLITAPWAAEGQIGVIGNGQNKKIVYARSISDKITIDGELDEPAWKTADIAKDFVQREPTEGALASEWTEVRIIYDRDTLYIGAYCHDRTPDRIVINDISRDFDSGEQDYFGIILDTFNDDSSGYYLVTTPVGGQRDLQFFNEGRDSNTNWDGVWYAEARQHEDYWSAEIAIPFKTLRFPRTKEQVWGAQFFRRIRRNNEGTYWSPIPRRYTVTRAIAFAGELRGIENVEPGRNFYLKPYGLAGMEKFESRGEGWNEDFDGGFDVKSGLASNLVLDLTVNTDFSQVEADTQQVNLTRFPILFPEKRDFFLENAGIFLFGAPENNEALLFHSRTIGLAAGQKIPILGGVRLTGRAGRNNLGLLNMQTRSEGSTPATNFTVMRVRRDILSASNVGAIFLNRRSGLAKDYNRAMGVDSNLLFFRTDLRISSALAKTWSPDRIGHDWLGRLNGEWQSDLFRFESSYLDIGKNFNAEMGFVRRPGRRILRNEIELKPRFQPETRVGKWVRDISLSMSSQQVLLPNDRLHLSGSTETKNLGPRLLVTFQDGSTFQGRHSRIFERLTRRFLIHDPIFISIGDYRYKESLLSYSSNRSKTLSASLTYTWGDFYDGEKKTINFTTTYRPGYRFSTNLSYEVNQVNLTAGNFSTHLAGLRTGYTFNPKLTVNAFLQYNSETDQFITNLRFRFIHHPLSDIYVVYNEQRDNRRERTDHALTIKYTHLLTF